MRVSRRSCGAAEGMLQAEVRDSRLQAEPLKASSRRSCGRYNGLGFDLSRGIGLQAEMQMRGSRRRGGCNSGDPGESASRIKLSGLQAEPWKASSRRSCGRRGGLLSGLSRGSGLQAEMKTGALHAAEKREQVPGGAVKAGLRAEQCGFEGDALGGRMGQRAPGGAVEGNVQAELLTTQRARVRSVEGQRSPGGDLDATLHAEIWLQEWRSRRTQFTDEDKRAPGGAVEVKL